MNYYEIFFTVCLFLCKVLFVKVALEKEMEVHREVQQKQMAKLRDEIQENEALIAELKELVHKKKLSIWRILPFALSYLLFYL